MMIKFFTNQDYLNILLKKENPKKIQKDLEKIYKKIKKNMKIFLFR